MTLQLQLIGDLLDPKQRFWKTRWLSPQVTRALELVRDPVFDHFRKKGEVFSKFCNFTFKKSSSQGLDFLSNNFLCVFSGVTRSECGDLTEWRAVTGRTRKWHKQMVRSARCSAGDVVQYGLVCRFSKVRRGYPATYGPGSRRIVTFQRNLKVLRPE